MVYSLDELAVHAMSAERDPEFYAEDEIHRYSEGFHLKIGEMESDFTSDAKNCQPVCEFPILRPKEQNESPIEYYFQYQLKQLVEYIKQFHFQHSDITDIDMTLLIDMLMDWKDVNSLHKFDVGNSRRKINVTLKPNVELKR